MNWGSVCATLLWASLLQAAATGSGQAADDARDAGLLYRQHCAGCHGERRLGGMGPALLPESLARSGRDDVLAAISDGLPATQMPGFRQQVDEQGRRALVELLFSPVLPVPTWTTPDIEASRISYPRAARTPVGHDFDPLNLFLVVEAGSHHVSVLDGDRFEVLSRFRSRHALHGGIKYSPDGRFAWLASRDGWVSMFDMHRLALVAEVRAGLNTRNIAVSADGRYVAVANYLPNSLVILDAADLGVRRYLEVADGSGNGSRVSAVYDAPPRGSFIAALKDIEEVWEISYVDDPPYHGMVHDYRDEGPPQQPEAFPLRRILLDDYLDDFFFDTGYRHLIGAARNARNGQVVNLDVGRKIADIAITGLPHMGSGITWPWRDTTVLATPNLARGTVTIIDMKTWRTIRELPTLGPGFFMRSHENSPYAWVDVFSGPDRDAMHIIDKASLEIVHTLRPEPGHTSAHVEFTRDGRYALLSIWEEDGAVLVIDARTLETVRRLPMDKPSGKYNVGNKISGSAGTSH